MIYLTFGYWAQAYHKVPPLLALNVTNKDLIKTQTRYYAESIFEFINGSTIYYKDRTNSNYQYTDVEIIIFKLKNG